jgi:folate-binding protein YgfZ
MSIVSAATRVSPLLDRPGAVVGSGVDAGVAAHYGDPLAEQRLLLHGGPAAVDRSHRAVVRVSGPDRRAWLHSLLSQHLESLGVGETREALLLSPHGHVEQHMVITDDGDQTWIDLEPGQAPGFAAYLTAMRFMLRVEVADVTDDVAVVTVVGDLQDVPAADGAIVSRDLPWGRDLLLPRTELSSVVDRLGLPLAGHAAFEAVRVEHRRPRFGFETDHRTIPHEVGWIGPAVHLDKGCYRGQETVARVHNLGRPPRRLVLVHFDGSREHLPPPGTVVSLDDRVVGFLGTTGWHAELGPVGLAVVKRQVADDAHLVAAEMAVAIDPTPAPTS